MKYPIKDSLPDSQNIHSKYELRKVLHDLSGPLSSARGFTEELMYVRENIKGLLDSLGPNVDAELMKSLQYQVDDEMQHCLVRVERSLEKLDSTIESIRSDFKQAS